MLKCDFKVLREFLSFFEKLGFGDFSEDRIVRYSADNDFL